MKDPDAKKKEWLQFRLQASNGFTGLPNRMLDSKPFAMLTTGAEVKCLAWFWQEAKYEKKKRKPGTESPIGRIDKITNNGEISFTFQQAEWRGVLPRTFHRVVRKLHRLGFIDVAQQGRGRKNEYTKYALSARWQRFDTPEWKDIPYPEPFEEGFASKDFQEKQRDRRLKKGGQKCPLPVDRIVHYALADALNSGQKSPRETPDSSQPQWTEKSTSIDLVMPTGSKKMSKIRSSAPDTGSKTIAAASNATTSTPKPWRPPLSEIKENVAEILLQRPDPRANDPRFVRFLAEQLKAAQLQRLDPSRVHRDLRERHDLDDWTSDLLFTVATIDLQFRGATN